MRRQDPSPPAEEISADLLIAGYRRGIFPMPAEDGYAWWKPARRAVLPLDGLRVTRSLAKSCRRFTITVDADFASVIEACADPGRPGAWIDGPLHGAYLQLHERGVAHSVEVWDAGGDLAGGLFGVGIGGLFSGESMFFRQRDASKVALVALVEVLGASGYRRQRLLDCQWLTPHLESMGAREVSGRVYGLLLRAALRVPGAEFDSELPAASGKFGNVEQ